MKLSDTIKMLNDNQTKMTINERTKAMLAFMSNIDFGHIKRVMEYQGCEKNFRGVLLYVFLGRYAIAEYVKDFTDDDIAMICGQYDKMDKFWIIHIQKENIA